MVKRLLSILLVMLPFAAAAQGYAELYEGEDAQRIRHDAAAIRAAASPDALADYLDSTLRQAGPDMFDGPDYRSFGIRRSGGDTAVFRNICGCISGYDRSLRDRYIVVGARMDAGNAEGLAVLLELTRRLSTNSALLKRSVILAAFGGSSEANAGSWYFINRAFTAGDCVDAMVNLDLFSSPATGLRAYTASNADLDRMIDALNSTLQPARPERVTSEPAPSEHRSFYGKGIPSVFFTTAGPGWSSRPATDAVEYGEIARQTEYICNFVMTLASASEAPAFDPKERMDRISGAGTVPFQDCDVKPTFFGSSDPRSFLARWVYVYMKYPSAAVENGIQGKVLVNFVIDEEGKVTDVSVRKGVHPLLDAEAVRVIEASPDWKPGRVEGRKVRSEISLYVEFRLKKKK